MINSQDSSELPEELRLSSILSSYSARNLSLRLENDYKATFFNSLDIQNNPIHPSPVWCMHTRPIRSLHTCTSLTSKELGQSCTCGKGMPKTFPFVLRMYKEFNPPQ